MIPDVPKEALEAETRIRSHVRETPTEISPYLGHLGNCRVHLKLENLQATGSFKLRGATNKFLSLSEAERQRTLITASSGNHGSAFAYVLKRFGARGVVYLPRTAAPAKVEALRLLDAQVRFHGDDGVETERFARRTAEAEGHIYVSPYNDLKIIGGQATIGVELERQIESMDSVLVPVGGGGLISGIAGYLKSTHPGIEIIGCQPVNSAVMYESIKAGAIVEMASKPTISDGSAGGIEAGAITFGLCRSLVDDYVLVTEEEIAVAIRLVLEKHHLLVEGSGALSVAAFIKSKDRFEGKDVVAVLSGAKIGAETLRRVLSPGGL